uniref:Uncharacterized protein n=1 Tax=Romanomermis culicivorax TaxID=13658 RepID=A0A915JC47_ROMCU
MILLKNGLLIGDKPCNETLAPPALTPNSGWAYGMPKNFHTVTLLTLFVNLPITFVPSANVTLGSSRAEAIPKKMQMKYFMMRRKKQKSNLDKKRLIMTKRNSTVVNMVRMKR